MPGLVNKKKAAGRPQPGHLPEFSRFLVGFVRKLRFPNKPDMFLKERYDGFKQSEEKTILFAY
jgi:hypothetical protein